ncbi:MAG: methylcobamide--CoM methyltransferase [Spirochaetaceae bacterium]|jgi:[methyl-Co(III) methanol-specific corrinoid protein]:coenzyme M methyltransferase|nr:methylcobamide--CoM methyltransferase [Spirochaetaceae bacterium]
MYSPRERLLRTLKKEAVDRPPVISPGGMMNAAVTGVMKKTGNTLPEAHHHSGLMENLARSVMEETGFENFGLPFCMTIESEALGSEVDYGTLECEPKIAREAWRSVTEAALPSPGAIEKNPRAGAVINSIFALSKKHSGIPAVGCITGPLSTAASLVEPTVFLRELRRERERAHRLLAGITRELCRWALLMAENGAAAVTIADPTATGEILGPTLFEEYAVRYINEITDAVRRAGTPVIIHICGDVRAVKQHLCHLRGDAISTDAMVNLAELKAEYPALVTMGNLSTYLLDTGSENTVRSGTAALLRRTIDIIAPACGLSTSTPLANLKAFTETVKDFHATGSISV